MEAASPDLSFQGSRPARHTGRAQGARRRWLCAGVRVECELTRREGRRALLLAIAVAVRRRVDLWPSGWWLAHAGRADRAWTDRASSNLLRLAPRKAARWELELLLRSKQRCVAFTHTTYNLAEPAPLVRVRVSWGKNLDKKIG